MRALSMGHELRNVAGNHHVRLAVFILLLMRMAQLKELEFATLTSRLSLYNSKGEDDQTERFNEILAGICSLEL